MRHLVPNRSRSHLFPALMLLVAFAGCDEARRSPIEPERPATFIGNGLYLVPLATQAPATSFSQLVGPAGGVLEISGGHSLTFPPGALAAGTLITAGLDGDELKLSFGPEGLEFPDSARPTLTFDYGAAATARDGGAVIVYLDDGGALGKVLKTRTDPERKMASAQVSHFSTYALATD